MSHKSNQDGKPNTSPGNISPDPDFPINCNEPSWESQSQQTSPKRGIQQEILLGNGDGDQIKKRRVGTWKKKARLGFGTPMQIKGVIDTKRSADIGADTKDSEKLAREEKKKT
ncbi:hypothetical protein U1Q18_000891, partial [Sarracenia purpurea var. burkii]